ncbi:MAG: hypothetical protein K1X78_05255 [Verrucomicrobiaceae bacterium]|nr:hypothetical protein [Verrucomicrobiaceae bacterium]
MVSETKLLRDLALPHSSPPSLLLHPPEQELREHVVVFVVHFDVGGGRF